MHVKMEMKNKFVVLEKSCSERRVIRKVCKNIFGFTNAN